jgi:hypothetical protein
MNNIHGGIKPKLVSVILVTSKGTIQTVVTKRQFEGNQKHNGKRFVDDIYGNREYFHHYRILEEK